MKNIWKDLLPNFALEEPNIFDYGLFNAINAKYCEEDFLPLNNSDSLSSLDSKVSIRFATILTSSSLVHPFSVIASKTIQLKKTPNPQNPNNAPYTYKQIFDSPQKFWSIPNPLKMPVNNDLGALSQQMYQRRMLTNMITSLSLTLGLEKDLSANEIALLSSFFETIAISFITKESRERFIGFNSEIKETNPKEYQQRLIQYKSNIPFQAIAILNRTATMNMAIYAASGIANTIVENNPELFPNDPQHKKYTTNVLDIALKSALISVSFPIDRIFNDLSIGTMKPQEVMTNATKELLAGNRQYFFAAGLAKFVLCTCSVVAASLGINQSDKIISQLDDSKNYEAIKSVIESQSIKRASIKDPLDIVDEVTRISTKPQSNLKDFNAEQFAKTIAQICER